MFLEEYIMRSSPYLSQYVAYVLSNYLHLWVGKCPTGLYSSKSALIVLPIRFPFLFYSTTYVGQIMAYEHNKEPDKDVATRAGEFAMLIYSIGESYLELAYSCVNMTFISGRCGWIFAASLSQARSALASF
jgi:hypothetical protein